MSLTSLSQILIKKVATLKDRTLSTISSEIAKLKDKCPTQPQLLQIINTRNQIVNSLDSLKTQEFNSPKLILIAKKTK